MGVNILYLTNEIDNAIRNAWYIKDTRYVGMCRQDIKDGIPVIVSYNGEYDKDILNDRFSAVFYHRLISNIPDTDTNGGFGTTPLSTLTITMRLVCFGDMKKINKEVDVSYKIAEEIKGLIPSRLSAVQLTNLTAQSGVITKSDINLDKRAVFAEELPEIEYRIKPNQFLFSIDYVVRLKFLGDCQSLSCDITQPLIDLRAVTCDNLTDPTYGLTEEQLTCVGGGMGNVTVRNSDNSYTQSVNCGDTLVLPDEAYNVFIDGSPVGSTTSPALKNEIINVVWQ